MKKSVSLIVCACILLGSAIYLKETNKDSLSENISKEIGVNIEEGVNLSCSDTHLGNGDGITFLSVMLDSQNEKCIRENKEWKKLPLSYVAEILAHGKDGQGPYICNDNQTSVLPRVEKGYYLLKDRQESKMSILDRASFNITLAIYDEETRILYYTRLDT